MKFERLKNFFKKEKLYPIELPGMTITIGSKDEEVAAFMKKQQIKQEVLQAWELLGKEVFQVVDEKLQNGYIRAISDMDGEVAVIVWWEDTLDSEEEIALRRIPEEIFFTAKEAILRRTRAPGYKGIICPQGRNIFVYELPDGFAIVSALGIMSYTPLSDERYPEEDDALIARSGLVLTEQECWKQCRCKDNPCAINKGKG